MWPFRRSGSLAAKRRCCFWPFRRRASWPSSSSSSSSSLSSSSSSLDPPTGAVSDHPRSCPHRRPATPGPFHDVELRSTQDPSSQRPRLTLTSVVTVNESDGIFFQRPVTPNGASSGGEWDDGTLNGDYAPAEEGAEEDLIQKIGDFRDAEASLVYELADTSIQYLSGENSYCDPYWSDSPSTIANQDYGSEEEKGQTQIHSLIDPHQIVVPSDDPFSESPDVRAGMYDGPIEPTEFYNASPPYHPWGLRGRTPLRLICQSLNMPVYTPVQAIADFLARNISIIRHLVFQTVAHPDWFFEHALSAYEVRVTGEARERYRDLLRAIGEVSWQDVRIESALKMATERTDSDLRRLSMMRKARLKNMPPAAGYHRVRAPYSEVVRRRARSHSLLRHVINADDLEYD